MVASSTGKLMACVRQSVALDTDDVSDAQLLASFIAYRDEAAFVQLVRRHGPMVLGVCRRVLNKVHDAEDAFQATFLILVRKAEMVRPPERVGPWLYGVAYRTALKARSMTRRREARERRAAESQIYVSVAPGGAGEEWRALLDGELNRLPEKFRAAVVLCDLEGLSRREAARVLGVPEGTLSSRLATARVRLSRRLSRYGLLCSGGALASVLNADALACVPAPLLTGTAAAAVGSGIISTQITTLVEGVLTTMWLTKCKLVLVPAMAVVIFGLGVATLPELARATPDDVKKKPPAEAGSKEKKAPTDASSKDKKAPAEAGAKEKKPQAPSVQGVLTAIDTGKGTITLNVPIMKKQTEEKTLALAADVKVFLDESFSKEKQQPQGKLADLTPGVHINALLNADGKAVSEIHATGAGVNGGVKAIDVGNKSITIQTKSKDGPGEHILTITDDAKVLLNDGLSKQTPDQEGKLSDLVEGTRVNIFTSVDGKRALRIRVLGGSLNGTVKGVDTGNNTLTISYKGDGQIVEKTLKLAKDAKIDGGLVAGARVAVQLSVFDKETAVAVRVQENKED